MKVSRYTPSLLAPEDLEAIFVQRHKLANRLVEQIRASVLTDSKQFNLLIGPRGIGKTHLISMLYHRVAQQEDLKSHLVIAWLREEEWGIGSFFDLVLRILNALQAEYQDDDLASKISSFYDISPKEVEQVALATLKTFIGKRTLLLLMENLEDVFAGLGDIGQKQLRSFLQEQGCCTIVATSQSLFNGVKLQTSPFYGFFRIQYLKDFAVDEAVSLLTKIAQQEEDSELVDFLQTPKGRSRVQAVHHLAGGNPRIYVVFSEFLTHESLDDLVQPFMNMLDDLTPYYQARMMYLSPQQRKIIEVLSRRKYAMPVKEIAQRCFVTHQTVSNQLKDLRDKGYVLADSIGRQSFYELREPLMRICLSVKETRGEPIRLFVDFLKAWYPRSELQGIQQRLGKDNIRGSEELSRLTGNEYQQSVRANSKQSSSIANDAYLALALVEKEEEELDPKIAACVQERNQQYEQQNFKEALTIAKKLVQIRGRDVDHHWLGNIQSDLGRYEEAIASYDKALEFKPDNDQAWYNRGVDLGYLGRYEEAIASYDKALEIKPDNDQAWYNRGVDLRSLGRYEEAISSYDKVLEFKPDDDQAWYNRGV
ncbi:tetratricopeptide repeat protein, partial [Acaryochloris marina NIES-2412]|uniref:tetratricopeptide repeat protein n=1 Tax=Acaryochloris marina TaxID=155978 RepID=UPI0040590837